MLIEFIKKEAQSSFKLIVITAILSGIANSLLLVTVNSAAAQLASESKTIEIQHFLIFFVSFCLFVYTQHYTLSRSSILIEKIVLNIRSRISKKLSQVDLNYIEHNGVSKIYTRLVQNSSVLSDVAIGLSFVFQSALMVIVSLLYLAWLSVVAFFLYVLFFIVGAYVFISFNKKLQQQINQTIKKEAEFLEYMNFILKGFKELKLNQKKTDALLQDMHNIAEITQELKSNTKYVESVLLVYGRSMFYILLGLMAFALPILTLADTTKVYELISTNLFIMGPVSSVVGFAPSFNRINIAIRNLQELENELDAIIVKHVPVTNPFQNFNVLKLNKLAFDYTDEDGRVLFSIMDINFELKKGEMVFIVGGNGSGKSTLLKLLTGLYQQTEGYIELDSQKITSANLADYRQLFASVFSDFCLFNKLHGLEHIEINQMNELLNKVELRNKTSYQNGQFTRTDLSTGQRKRLAFISAWLEDKAIYIFDELAADQDPQFRQRFYEVILPELKSLGKSIVAVTHDDKYFHLADRVLKMDTGYLSDYPLT